MNYNKKRILFILLLPIVITLAALSGAIIRLISLQTIIISFIIVYIISNKKLLLILKRIIIRSSYYLRSESSNFTPPKDRSQAAKQSLKSIDQIIKLVQNNIASEALQYEKSLIESELLRGDLVIVFLGAGSSGKTSIIRALLKKIVGEIGPNMGSTKHTDSYRLRLKSVVRGINLVDTPGILEGGQDGRIREKEALLKASRADLIVFVADSDLRAYEMELITSLSKIGKRLFIAINKCDLLTEFEEIRLLSLIKNHCRGLVSEHDIIPISASPQSIPVIGSRPLQPRAEINQLIKRIAIVLHHEGEELIADNILMQCRNLGESGRKLLSNQRLKEAKKCTERYVWISSSVVFITPLPGVDLLGTAVVNGRMVMDISKIFGVNLTKGRAKFLAISLGQTIAGLGIVKGGVSIISNSLSLHIPTYLIGKSIQSVTAAWLTKVAGESLITYFEQDQDWGDGGIQEVVQRHYDLNSREKTLRQFIKLAMKRVVKPITEMNNKQLPPSQRLQGEGGAFDLEHQE